MGYVINQNVDIQLMILLNFIVHRSCMMGGGIQTNKLQFNYGQILIN
jgi:hypothetical protein